jgi:ABC-type transport system substrate-binding protein
MLNGTDVPPFGVPWTTNTPAPWYTATLESLLEYDEQGQLVPNLATAWKVEPETRTITLTLRKGVKFHDGTDFNAEAAQWNLNQYKASGRPELAQMTAADVVDDATVRLTLAEWNNQVITFLGFSRGGLMISPTAFQQRGQQSIESNPVGTGPFKLTSWQKDVKQVYERFDGYWQSGKPYLDRVEISFIPDATARLAALQAGEADLNIQISAKQAADLTAAGKFNLTRGDFGVYGLGGDGSDPNSPFADVRVRKAMSHAIDSAKIAETFGYGYTPWTNQPVPQGSWSYNPAVAGYPYDVAKAKALLSEAGYGNGFKTTITTSQATPGAAVSEAAQGYLKAVGIETEIRVADAGLWSRYVFNGVDGIMGYAILQQPDPLGTLFRHFTGTGQFPSILQSQLSSAVTAGDDATRQRMVHDVMRTVVDEDAMITFLYTAQNIAARHAKLHDDRFFVRGQFNPTLADAWLEA